MNAVFIVLSVCCLVSCTMSIDEVKYFMQEGLSEDFYKLIYPKIGLGNINFEDKEISAYRWRLTMIYTLHREKCNTFIQECPNYLFKGFFLSIINGSDSREIWLQIPLTRQVRFFQIALAILRNLNFQFLYFSPFDSTFLMKLENLELYMKIATEIGDMLKGKWPNFAQKIKRKLIVWRFIRDEMNFDPLPNPIDFPYFLQIFEQLKATALGLPLISNIPDKKTINQFLESPANESASPKGLALLFYLYAYLIVKNIPQEFLAFHCSKHLKIQLIYFMSKFLSDYLYLLPGDFEDISMDLISDIQNFYLKDDFDRLCLIKVIHMDLRYWKNYIFFSDNVFSYQRWALPASLELSKYVGYQRSIKDSIPRILKANMNQIFHPKNQQI
jgi:hypothetical protein